MPKLTCFADEISADFTEQLDVLEECGLGYLDLRGVWNKNVLELSDDEISRLKEEAGARGIEVAAIGSPIGKSTIDKPASYEMDRLERACEIAKLLGATYIRVFSFYAPIGRSILYYHDEVFDRMQAWVERVSRVDKNLVLTHENEGRIYGETPERCLEIARRLGGENFTNCYDPANFVAAGLTDIYHSCWERLKTYTGFLHLKDYAQDRPVPCGEGDAAVAETLADAYRAGFDGFMSVEPHLKQGGQFGGFSGPELFKKAVSAVKEICRAGGIPLD